MTRVTVDSLERFLREVDRSFPVPISSKQDLGLYARKLCERATLGAELDGERIVALVAGYTENVVEERAFISLVATVRDARGRGLGSRLVREFISVAAGRGLAAVHLYAVPTNIPAVSMYKKLGFEEWIIPDEPRPDDLHLIYRIKKEE